MRVAIKGTLRERQYVGLGGRGGMGREGVRGFGAEEVGLVCRVRGGEEGVRGLVLEGAGV